MFVTRVLLVLILVSAPLGADDFDNWFTGYTMRVDLYHTGTHDTEMFSLDEIVREGRWPGTRTKLIDNMNLGQYFLSVYDSESGALIYSRGFSSLFGEWMTTDEAKKIRRTMSESVRFPYPRKPVEVAISVRDEENIFREIYRAPIDPDYHNVCLDRRHADTPVINIHVPDDPRKVFDVLILPDGYTAAEWEKLRNDAARSAKVLLTTKPFSEYKDKISVRALEVFSRDSGPDEPRQGIWRDTAFGAGFNTFDSARYMMTKEIKAMRDYAANAPYDALLIMVNTPRYGGGGIFNLYTTYSVDNEYTSYLITHEGGHSMAGLGDEYYTSQVAYTDFHKQGVEPWEPNVTALLDPANVKWSDFVTEGVPIPTPATDEYKKDGIVGAFEGAGYMAKGLYRPAFDCKMISKGDIDFCPVCMANVRKLIEFYVEE